MVERGGKDSLVTALFLSRAVQVHDSAMRVTDDVWIFGNLNIAVQTDLPKKRAEDLKCG